MRNTESERYIRLEKEIDESIKDLSKFIIPNKSVLMIVENALGNLSTQQKVFRFVKQLYDELEDDDLFGLI